MKMFKKWSLVTLAALIFINSNPALTNVPIQVFAEERDAADAFSAVGNELEVIRADDSDLPDSKELFEGYVNKAFGIGNVTMYSSLAGDRLTGNERMIYDFLKEKIADVASGTLSDTNFEIPASELQGYQ